MSLDLAEQAFAIKIKDLCVASVKLCASGCEPVRLFIGKICFGIYSWLQIFRPTRSVNIKFEGAKSSLQLTAFKPIKIPKPVHLFEHHSPVCHPVDQDFIRNEIKKQLADDEIESTCQSNIDEK